MRTRRSGQFSIIGGEHAAISRDTKQRCRREDSASLRGPASTGGRWQVTVELERQPDGEPSVARRITEQLGRACDALEDRVAVGI